MSTSHTPDANSDRPPIWCFLDVGCPRCNADINEPCRNADDPNLHVERIEETSRQARITYGQWRALRAGQAI